ncbi:hypothetical protein MMC21_004140 [Puttea exsequens]|nr:hypothetical protein [Puttea exsequens]
MLPKPTFSFTIPSIHDDIALDCRVYNPPCKTLRPENQGSAWGPRGAIIAHPYAPMGGCYDDPVVESVAGEILKQGFVLGTFNFRWVFKLKRSLGETLTSIRGAGASQGRTSWQCKAEIHDYTSFAGFFIHYIEGLHRGNLESENSKIGSSMPSRTASDHDSTMQPPAETSKGMTLILGGYSYGSLITTYLPSTETILRRFESVSKGTAEAEIRLRAISLSSQWHKDARLQEEACKDPHDKIRFSARALAIAIGGDESEFGTRRHSHDGRRSMDVVRRSVDRGRKRLLRWHSTDTSEEALVVESMTATMFPLPRTCYLLISPVLYPISMFITMFSNVLRADASSREEILQSHPTLAVYGDSDFFTSQRRLRRWVEHMECKPGSLFHFREVQGAGHFWREEGVGLEMKRTINEWIQSLFRGFLY